MYEREQQFYVAVGQIATLYSKCEHNLARIIDLLSKSERGTKILYQSKFNNEQRLNEYKEVYTRLRQQIPIDYLTLVDDLNQIRTIRNYFVHAYWITVDGDEQFGYINDRTNGQTGFSSSIETTAMVVESLKELIHKTSLQISELEEWTK
jgi:hypothetical protein